jgi:hypothetical protein
MFDISWDAGEALCADTTVTDSDKARSLAKIRQFIIETLATAVGNRDSILHG